MYIGSERNSAIEFTASKSRQYITWTSYIQQFVGEKSNLRFEKIAAAFNEPTNNLLKNAKFAASVVVGYTSSDDTGSPFMLIVSCIHI